MPSGDTHEDIEFCVLPLAVAAGVVVDRHYIDLEPTTFAAFIGAYLFSIYFMSPDLDLRRCNARKHWGLLGTLWEPYCRLFAHRGMSHSLLWGTGTRVVYLTGVVVTFYLSGTYFFGWPPLKTEQFLSFVQSYPSEISAVYLGLFLPNAIHITADRLS